ncbi:MAG: hypothetical protein AAGD00_06995 [Planctomycetota bacterium]
MGVTSKLLNLYRVDQQLSGLKRKLKAAERYLNAQSAQRDALQQQAETLKSQLRQLEASAHNDEQEVNSMEERMLTLRDRANTAQTSKEHTALLTELNTVKADKTLIEERGLGRLTEIDSLRTALAEVEAQIEQRGKVVEVAKKDRDERETEIRDRVEELEQKREAARAEVPAAALALYEERQNVASDDEEVMAAIEELSRKDMEYTCGACYTIVPAELTNRLLQRGDLSQCGKCHAILYIEDGLRDEIQTAADKKRAKNATAQSR